MTDRSGARRIALVSVFWALAVAVTKITVGLATGAVSLIGDGVHSAIDVVAISVSYVAVRASAKPPDAEHPYGHGRAENLAALAESGLMTVGATVIAWEAVQRLYRGEPLQVPVYALAVVGATIVVDAARVVVLRRAARRYSSPALAADAANFAADIAESVAVLAGLFAVRLGAPVADPIAALVVVAGMWWAAGRIGVGAVNVIMERQPETLTLAVESAVAAVEGVQDVRDLRIRRSGPDVHADVTVGVGRTASVEHSHDITEAVEDAVAGTVPGASTSVHVEPTEAGEDVVARSFAAANRIGTAHQVHNVLSIRHPEGLWLMLHAKVPAAMPLDEAHEVADRLEAELRREIDGLVRVEVHLEPLESTTPPGRDVTADHETLVRTLTRIAESHAPITACHEVALSRTADGAHVVLHCEAAGDQPIGAIHAASTRIESQIHERYRDVRSVTVHFEPEGG